MGMEHSQGRTGLCGMKIESLQENLICYMYK